MKKLSYKIVIPVAIIILFMASLLVTFSIYMANENISREAEDKLLNMSGKYANEFSNSLEKVDSKVKAIEALIESTIESDNINQLSYMISYKNDIKDTIKQMAATTDGILGAYIFFNPEVVAGAHDIYFTKDTDGNFIRQAELEEDSYDQNDTGMGWFYQPYKLNQAIWTDPFYYEVGDDLINMVSHTRAVVLNGKFIGTIGIDMKIDEIKSKVESINPYQTGYAFIMNQENEFLVHPEYQDKESLLELGFQEINEKIKENDSGMFDIKKDEQTIINSYAKLSNDWIMGIAVPESEVMEGLYKTRNYLIGIGFLAVFLAVIVMFYIGNSIAKPISQAAETAAKIADSDLTVKMPEGFMNRNDEVGILAQSINRMTDSLRNIISNMSDIASNLSASSQELSASSEEISASAEQVGTAIEEVASGAEEQSAQIDETTVNVSELVEEVEKVGNNSEDMNDQADKVMNSIEKGNDSIEESITQVNRVKEQSGELSDKINALGGLSEEIGEIIELINGIAEQTNLLALNAAIEAARAGEAGRGFSVVADEIRELSEESAEATEQISGLINEIRIGVKEAVNIKQKSQKLVTNSVDAIEITDNAFSTINEAAVKLRKLIENIASGAKQMSMNSQEVDRAVREIAAVSQEASSNAEEVAASSEEQSASTQEIANASENLTEMAQRLSEVVEQFKI